MLAYVFWHWKQKDVDREFYEARLIEFQNALRQANPPGLKSATVFRTEGVPWINSSGVYEDWYVLENSGILDVLEEVAVSGDRQEPHNAAARLAAGGTGALYKFRQGSERLTMIGLAYWFVKPDGMTYQQLYQLLEPVYSSSNVSLWGRQLALGPSPEFCLHSVEPVELPAEIQATKIPITPIYSRL